jgi:hypothetical protein
MDETLTPFEKTIVEKGLREYEEGRTTSLEVVMREIEDAASRVDKPGKKISQKMP